MMLLCKCFPHASKMPAFTRNPANRVVVIKNAVNYFFLQIYTDFRVYMIV